MHSPRRTGFAPSFVITLIGASSLVAAGCQGKTQPETITPEPPPKKTEGANTTAKAQPTRKRNRTSPAVPPKYANSPVPFGELKGANPVEGGGRAVYVAHDDTCFVKVLMDPMPKELPAGKEGVKHVPVDCPVSMDDPAWDACGYSTLYVPTATAKAKDCYCAPSEGNPPPPPAIVVCPKTK